ncbi:MAG: hypothetical protein ACRD6W_10145 [Nitrososphaerales archaeon]
MALPVYSTPFLQYTIDTPITAYAVPEGYTAVVRYASYFDTASVGNANVYIQDSEDAPPITICYLPLLTLEGIATQDLRVVVPYPGLITLFVGWLGGGPQVYVGGYLLTGVLGGT